MNNIISNLRKIGFVLAIIIAVWFFKDWQFQKAENIRQTENSSQLRKADSLHYASQILTAKEIQDYLQYSNSDLGKKLTSDKIDYNRIESIVSQKLKYIDSEKRTNDVTKIVDAVKNNIPTSTPIIDSTKCLTIKGFLEYKNDSLKLSITERIFNNQSDAVAYWERRQWKFIGIKTRFLGKKQFTAKNYSNCGEVQTMKIEKKQ